MVAYVTQYFEVPTTTLKCFWSKLNPTGPMFAQEVCKIVYRFQLENGGVQRTQTTKTQTTHGAFHTTLWNVVLVVFY